MMNLNALKIDPEFQGKIPPLTFEELNQLEANILRDGRIINPIIVWQGLIVDGHNRYTIAKKHPEIPFTVHEKEFASRYEAIIWICKNQLSGAANSMMRRWESVFREYVTKDFGFLRGEIYYADLAPHYGSEQGGKRPVIVIQNNTRNKFSPTVIVAAVTSKVSKKPNQPTHVLIDRNPAFSRPSMVLLE